MSMKDLNPNGPHVLSSGAKYMIASAAAVVVGLLSCPASAAVTGTWTGAVDGSWDTATANWSNGGSGIYTDADTAIFSGGSNTSITVQAAGVSPASTTFQSTSTSYSFTNASGTTGIAGAGGLTLAGTYGGTVTLNSANIYTGATIINGGTLDLRNASAIGGSALTIGNGGTLNLRADADTTFSPASFSNLTAGSSYNLAVNGVTGAGTGKTLSIMTPAIGGGGATNTTLNVSSTSGDTLKFTTSFRTNSNSGAAWTTGVQNVFNLAGANVVLDAGLSMGNNGNGGITVNSTTGNSLTINGTVAANTNRTMAGIVNSGVLILNNSVSLGGTNQGFFVTLNGGTLRINAAGAIRNNSVITGTRAGLAIAGGTLDNTSGAALTLSFNPTVLFNGDFAFSTATGNSANSLNLGTGAVSLGPNAGTTRTITTNGSATLTVGGAIADGTTAKGLTKSGSGILALNGSNTYTGTTTVQNGTLKLGASGTISSTLVLGVSGGTSGILDATAKTAFSQANVSGKGTIDIGSGKAVTITGSLAPGFSTGVIDVTGDLVLGASTTMELAGTGGVAGTDFDLADAAGALTYGGSLSVLNYGAFDAAAQNGSYKLFDFASHVGNFSSVTIGSVGLARTDDIWTGSDVETQYSFNQANGVLTVAVPEPAAAGILMLLGGASLLSRRRPA